MNTKTDNAEDRSLHSLIRRYPVVHIYGAVGARAAVLVKHRNAKPKNTGQRGDKWPIYAIIAGKVEIGRGHGTSDAWEQTARALYAPNDPKLSDCGGAK